MCLQFEDLIVKISLQSTFEAKLVFAVPEEVARATLRLARANLKLT